MLKRIGRGFLKILSESNPNTLFQILLKNDEEEEMRRANREWVWNVKSISNPDTPPFNPDDPSNDFF